MTNVFTISEDVIYTPTISKIGIKGIMREIVLEKFSNYFKDIVQCKISKERLLASESIFLTNSIIKIIPVKNIEGKTYKIDKRVKNLMKQFNSLDFLKSN